MQLEGNKFIIATVGCGNNRHVRVLLSQISDPFGKPLVHVFFEDENGERIIRNVDANLALFCRNFFSEYQYRTVLDAAKAGEIRERFAAAVSALSRTDLEYTTLSIVS